MIYWLGGGLVILLVLWMCAIEAFDQLEAYDRKKEEESRPKFTDRLVRYQERDY